MLQVASTVYYTCCFGWSPHIALCVETVKCRESATYSLSCCIIASLNGHPYCGYGSNGKWWKQSSAHGRCLIHQPLTGEMHHGNCISREGNRIDFLATDVVSSKRTGNRWQKSPSPEHTRAESCYLSSRSWTLVRVTPQIFRAIAGRSAKNRCAGCLECALDYRLTC